MRIAVVALSLLLVAACGGGGEPETGPTGVAQNTADPKQPGSEFLTPVPADKADAMPDCSEVWVAGNTLPADYTGCRIVGGGIDQGAKYACTDGKGVLIGYDEQFFARLGGTVQAYGDDEEAFSHELFQACKPNQP